MLKLQMADKNENKKAAANDATAFCLIDRVELVVLVTLISPKTTNRLLLDFHISFVYG